MKWCSEKTNSVICHKYQENAIMPLLEPIYEKYPLVPIWRDKTLL